jgi:hypothetical protein
MKFLLVLILILSQLNFANANSRGTLLKSFNFGERSIVAELNQYIYMLFDHEDKYFTYSLTTPGFNHVIDIPKLEMQKQLLEEKLFQSNVWQKKSFYYLNENYFFYRSVGALAFLSTY